MIDWPNGYRKALGVAHVLAYLHHGYDPRIIHGGVSSSNTLVDTEYEPYLSDFRVGEVSNVKQDSCFWSRGRNLRLRCTGI